MIIGGLLGAAFFAKFFSVFALGPVLVALGILANNHDARQTGEPTFETEQRLDPGRLAGHGRAADGRS